MLKAAKVQEVEGKGLIGLMGQRVTLFCVNYIYTGDLTGVNETCVLLTGKPAIVYETGAFTDKAWKDAQALPSDLYVQRCMIEAFAVVK